jgi:hypothetical protein
MESFNVVAESLALLQSEVQDVGFTGEIMLFYFGLRN